MGEVLIRDVPVEDMHKDFGTNPWELYSSVEGWEHVSKELTDALTKLLEELSHASHKVVMELVRYYGWGLFT